MMKFSQKIMFCVLSIALVAVSLDAAKRGRDDNDDERQPAAPKNRCVAVDQTTGAWLFGVCRAAQTRLEAQFPILLTGAGPSSPPAVTAAQLKALQGAAGALKMATAAIAQAGMDAVLHSADKLANDTIRALESVVLNTKAELTALAEAIDGYNDARGRHATAAGEPVARLRDVADNERTEANLNRQSVFIAQKIKTIFSSLSSPGTVLTAEQLDLLRQADAALNKAAQAIREFDSTVEFDEQETDQLADVCTHEVLNKGFVARHRDLNLQQTVYAYNAVRNRLPIVQSEIKCLVPNIRRPGMSRLEGMFSRILFAEEPIPQHMGVFPGDILANDIELVKGAFERSPDKDYYTFLHAAAALNKPNVIEFCLSQGANKDLKNVFNQTPLHLAARRGALDAVKFLWNNGAAREAQADGNSTPLLEAASTGQLNVVEFLWDNGADREATAVHSYTPLHVAAIGGHLDVVKFLWDNGADREAKASNSYTPLHVAVIGGHLDVVKFLWDNGAEREAETSSSYTPLHKAVLEGHLDIVKFLIENGANVRAKGLLWLTPLLLAQSIRRTNPTVYDPIIAALKAAEPPKSCMIM